MRTLVEVPEDEMAQLMQFSGAKSKREALRWAVKEAIRGELIRDVFDNPVKIEFNEKFLREHGVTNGKRAKRGKEVVADSLLWIDYLNGKKNEYATEVERLGRARILWLTGPVFCEVAIGPKTENERRYVLSRLNRFPFLVTSEVVWRLHIKLLTLPATRTRRVPWNDALIAAHCIVHDVALFTSDEHFDVFQI